jgi:hypothetical protein
LNTTDVIIHTGYSSLVVGAGPEFGIFGRRDRKSEELANALRYARSTAKVGRDETSVLRQTALGTPGVAWTLEGLPSLEPPGAPVGLYLFWLVYTPVVAWFLQTFPT